MANDQDLVNVIVMSQTWLKLKGFLEFEPKWEKISIVERHGHLIILAQEPYAECCQEFALWQHTKGRAAVNVERMSIKDDL